MKKFLALIYPFALIAAITFSLPAVAETVVATDNSNIVNAADAFIATLSSTQRAQVVYAFNDDVQRARWSNFPTGFVPRGGISFKQMSQPQRDAAMKLLALVLSPMGLEKVSEIRQADDDFKTNGSKRGPPGQGGPGGPGGPPPGSKDAPGGDGKRPPFSSDDMFGGDLYYISFVGKPSGSSPWMMQFGGHHLALNMTFSGDKDVMTPSLTGAQPASFISNGKTIRPIGRESDKALALLQSLDAKQRKQAVLDYQVPDLVLGPGEDGKKIVPDGMKASAMTSAQQAMLLDLIAEWAGIMNDRSSAIRMAQIKAELNATWFAWSGPTDGKVGSNITAYYRIQGPHLVIEYAPQHDEPGNHVHTIYRDPTNDYGSAITK